MGGSLSSGNQSFIASRTVKGFKAKEEGRVVTVEQERAHPGDVACSPPRSDANPCSCPHCRNPRTTVTKDELLPQNGAKSGSSHLLL